MSVDLNVLRKMLDDAKEELIIEIDKIDFSIDGVKSLSSNPSCFTISINTIAKNNFILSPSYYSAEAQKQHILDAINKTDNVFVCFNRLKDIVEKKKFSDGTICHPCVSEAIQRLLKKCNAE